LPDLKKVVFTVESFYYKKLKSLKVTVQKQNNALFQDTTVKKQLEVTKIKNFENEF
jgi:hypothetical protein